MTLATNAAVEVLVGDDSNMIDELLAGLSDEIEIEGFNADGGEVIESVIEAAMPLVDEAALEAAIEGVERKEAKQALYAQQKSNDASDGVAPETTVESLTTPADPKAKKSKEAKQPKPPKEPKEKKAPVPTSVSHKPGDLLLAKLGAAANDYLVFSLADAGSLSNEELAVKRAEFVEVMNNREGIAIKVKEKAIQLFTTLVKGGQMNKVMAAAFMLLATEGSLTSGGKGNLETALRASGLSERTSASQSNQIFMLLPLLNLTVKSKGVMSPNPDSALLPTIYANQGLTQAV